MWDLTGAPSQASPFDVVVVSQVVPLPLLLHAVEHGHRGHEVHDLPRGQQVKVGTAVSAAVAIAGDAQGWLRSLCGTAGADCLPNSTRHLEPGVLVSKLTPVGA